MALEVPRFYTRLAMEIILLPRPSHFGKRSRDSVSPNHPARFALVEIVNIHNKGIEFEPIHRLVKNVGIDILEALSSFFSNEINIVNVQDFNSLAEQIKNQSANSQLIGLIGKDQLQFIEILKPLHTLPVGSLQLFLDDSFIKASGNIT